MEAILFIFAIVTIFGVIYWIKIETTMYKERKEKKQARKDDPYGLKAKQAARDALVEGEDGYYLNQIRKRKTEKK